MKIKYIVLAIALSAVQANADDSTLNAAIGGGIGGAAGAAIGNEVGGRDGAIIGGALGGAVGAAVSTREQSHQSSSPQRVHYEYAPAKGSHPQGYHCPPGQRKKGRC
jgi:outer membrane lipoprotein SlyB